MKTTAKHTQSHTQTSPARQTERPESLALEAPDYGLEVLRGMHIQPKLSLGAPDDPYEREADAVAEQVMRNLSVKADPPDIQAKCASCEREEERLRRQGSGQVSTHTLGRLESRLQQRQNRGNALPPTLQTRMQEAFGADFGQVRIHADEEAAQMAGDIQALAFARGQDIYFAQGQYQPQTPSGQRLLAHELTHVVQQGGGAPEGVLRRAPANKDQAADNANINYRSARELNRAGWYEFGFRYFNIFADTPEKYSPVTTPNAYANEVYRLQNIIVNKIGIKTWETAPKQTVAVPLNGVFDLLTFQLLFFLAYIRKNDPKAWSTTYKNGGGIASEILDRVYTVYMAKTNNQPLQSTNFKYHIRFKLVNENPFFLVQRGDKGDYVTILQKSLEELNYDIGPDGADGKFGEDTENALKAFQRDAGLSGKEVDGVLGAKTLRLLDQRFSTRNRSKLRTATGRANALVFEIPVPHKMTAQEFLVHALRYIFDISEQQAENLTKLPGKQRWRWVTFTGISDADLNARFKRVSVDIASYTSLKGELKRQPRGGGQPPAEQLKELILRLQHSQKIYELNKKIGDTDEQIAINSMWGISTKSLDAKRKKLVDERNRELLRLGYPTNQAYKDEVKKFKEVFGHYAVSVAFKMLDKNETDVNVERTRYADSKHLQEGKAIKKIFQRLEKLYTQADKQFGEGVRREMKKDPYRYAYYGRGGIDPYQIAKQQHEKYRLKEKKADNPELSKCYELEHEAFGVFRLAVKDFPILAYQDLEIRKNIKEYAQKSPKEIEALMGEKIVSIKEKIEQTRQGLRSDWPKVWELPPVLQAAMQTAGIIPGSILETYIKEEIERRKDNSFWKSIGMAVLGIGLGLLALVSGPIGWAALAGSLTVGAIDAYNTYQDISFKKAAARSAMSRSKALSNVDPSYFWFYVALAGVALDAFDGVKAIKAFAQGAKAAKSARKLAQELTEELVKEEDELVQLLAKTSDVAEKSRIQKELARVRDVKAKVNGEKFIDHLDVFRRVAADPSAVIRLSDAFEASDEIAEAFKEVQKLHKAGSLADEAFERIVRYYAGPGFEALKELPDTMRVAKLGEVGQKAPELFTEILTHPRVQNVFLDNDVKPGLLIDEWQQWQKAAKAGKVMTFADHLAQNYSKSFRRLGSLTDEFGAGFAQLSHLARNRQVLRTVAPKLVDAYDAGKLSAGLQEAVEMFLRMDLISGTQDLLRAQMRVSKRLNFLAQSLELQSDFRMLASLVGDAARRRIIWEGATNVQGLAKYKELLKTYKVSDEVLDDLIQIGPVTDPDTVRRLITQDEFRKALVKYPDAIKALKKCASPCFPLNATDEHVERIGKLLAGKSDDQIARLNEFFYKNRNASSSQLDDLITSLETDFAKALKGVKAPAINIPRKWRNVTGMQYNIDLILETGFSSSQLNALLRNAAIKGVDGQQFIIDLRYAIRANAKQPAEKLSLILKGLASTSDATFTTSRFLLDELRRFGGPGLAKANEILSVFDLADLQRLMKANPGNQFINALHQLIRRVEGDKAQLLSLINRAGLGATTSKPVADISRLNQILDAMATVPGKHSISSVEQSIREANEFAAKLAAALASGEGGFESLVKLVWGKSAGVKDGVVEVADALKKGATGSGSKAYKEVLGNAEKAGEIVNGVVQGSKIDKVRWALLRKAIDDTAIATSIKNSIIGELWTRVNVQAYINRGYKVLREVEITAVVDGKTVVAKADAIAYKGKEIVVLEFKSGGAVLSDAQEIIYPLIQAGNLSGLKVADTLINQQFKENAARVAYKLVEESNL